MVREAQPLILKREFLIQALIGGAQLNQQTLFEQRLLSLSVADKRDLVNVSLSTTRSALIVTQKK
jgi:hypothetical protein